LIGAAQEIAERAWRIPERDFSTADAAAIIGRLGQRPALVDRLLNV
jgi:hypothetical protein